MKTIVFIGTQKSGSSREAIKVAERLGYFTVLFTNRLNQLEKRKDFPDVHMMKYCNLDDIDEIKKNIQSLQTKGISVNAIISFVDSYCYTASVLAEHFNVSHFSTEAIGKMENKIYSIEALTGTNYAPWYKIISNSDEISKDEIENSLPFIIKSPSSTGSKDVYKINTYKEYTTCYQQLKRSYPHEPVLIEEFLDGPQFLVEAVVFQNEVNIIAIIEQEITYNKRFIVTGYNLIVNPSGILLDSLTEAVKEIITCHGLESGPCHLEMRYVKSQWKLVEVNPRISGAGMNKMIEVGLGINLVEETLKFALGEDANFKPKHIQNVFAQYITVSTTGVLERVTGRHKALNSKGVMEVYIKPKKGSLLSEPTSMGHRYAYVIATGEDEESAMNNAKYAASQIKFKVSPI